MNPLSDLPGTFLGVGFKAQGLPREKARDAVEEALRQIGDVPPVIALVVSGDGAAMEEIVSEVRGSLPECTVLGCVAQPHDFSKIFPRGDGSHVEVGILILASEKVWAKTGVSTGAEGNWEERVTEAFNESFITHTARLDMEKFSNAGLFEWYLYRRPSLILALIVAPEDEKATRQQRAVDFLQEKLHGRTPILAHSLATGGGKGRLFAGNTIITDGIVLLTFKTEMIHKLERFHNFEPIGKKYFITKAVGKRVFELNNRPALPEYLHFQSDQLADAKSYAGYFALYPLSYRGREGRYHLILPEEVHEDLSLTLGTEPLPDVPLLHMISISSAQAGGLTADDKTHSEGGSETGELRIILLTGRLRDYYPPSINAGLGENGPRSLEIAVGGDFSAQLPEGDWEGETSHLALTLKDEIEPLAAVAHENERLLEEIFREQSKMEALVEGLAESLYIVDSDYRLQFHHHGAGPTFGRLEENPVGRRCYETLFQREFPCPWCALSETLATGQIVRQTVHLKEEGSYFQLTFSPWKSPAGRMDNSICLLVDTTAQHKLEEQMIQSKKLSSLSVLSAGMAHELNNPLGAINFNLEVLKGREKDEEYVEVLDAVMEDVQRINRIIGNLLTFSRSGAKSGEPLDTKTVVESSGELLAPAMEKMRVRVVQDFPDVLPKIWGNFQDLQQVFVNLLSNAADAMPAGGEIRIGARTVATAADGAAATRIAVLYEGRQEVDLLRILQYEEGWNVVYLRAGTEAVDYFSDSRLVPPDLLLLAAAGEDASPHLERLIPLVEDVCPHTKIIMLESSGGAAADDCTRKLNGDPGQTVDRKNLLQTLRTMVAQVEKKEFREVLELSIADAGIGIKPDQVERIFDPFFTTKDERRGTGLGLSVVHKILENHGAEIKVQSRLGEGTTFVLRFPITADPAGMGKEPYVKEKRSPWGKLFT